MFLCKYCAFDLILFTISTFRSVNIPSVQEAVERVTRGSRTMRSSGCGDNTPLGTDPQPQPPADTKKNNKAELSIVVSEEDQKACANKKLQTAKRSKKFPKAPQQESRKMLAELKKPQSETEEAIDLTGHPYVIEDCHVMTEDSSYADYLLEQGIDMSTPLQELEDTDIRKLETESSLAGAVGKQSVASDSLEIKPSDPSLPVTADTGMKIRQEYLGKFQNELNTFIWSAECEEESLQRIERLRGILDMMGTKQPEKKDDETVDTQTNNTDNENSKSKDNEKEIRKTKSDQNKELTPKQDNKEMKNEVDLKTQDEEKLKKEADLKTQDEEKLKKEADLKAQEEEKCKNEADLKAKEEKKCQKEADLKAKEEEKRKKDADLKAQEEEKCKNEADLKATECDKVKDKGKDDSDTSKKEMKGKDEPERKKEMDLKVTECDKVKDKGKADSDTSKKEMKGKDEPEHKKETDLKGV